MDILAILQEKNPEFSKGQRRISQYILESYDKAAFMTANKLGKTVIVVTHEQSLVDYYKQRVVVLKDGVITEDRVGGMFE